MAQLAEAYIHLRPYDASQKEARQLGRYIDAVAIRSARKIYRQRVVIDVELEEGSLRGWITLSGALIIYGAIADYKGFKESVGEIVRDARTFAETIYEPIVEKAEARREQVYRFERRLKTPGRLYRLSRELEKLEGSADQLSAADIKAALARLRSDLQKIEADLTPAERQNIEKIIQPNDCRQFQNGQWSIRLRCRRLRYRTLKISHLFLTAVLASWCRSAKIQTSPEGRLSISTGPWLIRLRKSERRKRFTNQVLERLSADTIELNSSSLADASAK